MNSTNVQTSVSVETRAESGEETKTHQVCNIQLLHVPILITSLALAITIAIATIDCKITEFDSDRQDSMHC